MSHFIYAENAERGAPPKVPYDKWRANVHWALHTYNRIVLDIFHAGTNDAREIAQIGNEILICERKRAFWTRHPNFEALEARAILKREHGIAELPGNLS